MRRLAVLFAAALLVLGSGCGPLAEWAGLAPWGNPSATDPAGHAAGPRGSTGAGRVLPGEEDEPGPGDGPAGLHWQRASLASVGDVLIHNTLLAAARQGDGTYDFGPALAAVAPALRAADLAVGNLEQPVTGADLGGYTGYPRFNSPPELLAALRQAGFDVLTNANNHTLDRGRRGVERTYANLERFGFIHAGTARTPEERDRIAIAEAGGIRIAFLAYTYGTNGIPLPAPYLVNLIDPRQIAADIARARRAGADLVSVSLHFGNEYETEPNRQQEDMVDQVLAAGADIVLGHHPHVLQRAELRPMKRAGDEAAAEAPPPGASGPPEPRREGPGRGPGEPGEEDQPGSAGGAPVAGAPAAGAPAAGAPGAGAAAAGPDRSCTRPGSGSGQPAGYTGSTGGRPCLYKAVLFSQGNFLAGQIGEDRMTSALFWLDLARDPLTGRAGVTGIRYVPLYIHKGRVDGRWLWRPLPAREAAGDPARYQVPQADVPLLERAYRRALERLEAPGVRWVPMEELAPAQGP